MTAKRVLQPDEQFRLREILQSATLAALMDSRRWEPGDLAFQGGTCLHLAHGSARFSEDLDFMVRGGLSLDALAGEIQRRLRLPADVPRDMSVTVSRARTERNPHAFMVSLGGPDVIGSAKVKLELWQTGAELMKSLNVIVSTIRSPAGSQAFVPVITLDEILADKVYALGARDRLKPRDVFDLWWLLDRDPALMLDAEMLFARLEIYPRGDVAATAVRWLDAAQGRLKSLQDVATVQVLGEDLKRWLPSSWALDPVILRRMRDAAALELETGIALIAAILPQSPLTTRLMR